MTRMISRVFAVVLAQCVLGAPLSDLELFEGDIAGIKIPKDIPADQLSIDELFTRNGVANLNTRWPGGIMYYTISDGFSEKQEALIKRGIAEFGRVTNGFTMVERRNETDYVRITRYANGCWSYVGRQGGQQELNLQTSNNPNETYCMSFGIIVHEMLHAAGFWHEQSRPDRDDYVEINLSNVDEDKHQNFKKHSHSGIESFGVPYDYNSLSHYGKFDFALDKQVWTIRPIGGQDIEIGQRIGLSDGDIQKLNRMYPGKGKFWNATIDTQLTIISDNFYPPNSSWSGAFTWSVTGDRIDGKGLLLRFNYFHINSTSYCPNRSLVIRDPFNSTHVYALFSEENLYDVRIETTDVEITVNCFDEHIRFSLNIYVEDIGTTVSTRSPCSNTESSTTTGYYEETAAWWNLRIDSNNTYLNIRSEDYGTPSEGFTIPVTWVVNGYGIEGKGLLLRFMRFRVNSTCFCPDRSLVIRDPFNKTHVYATFSEENLYDVRVPATTVQILVNCFDEHISFDLDVYVEDYGSTTSSPQLHSSSTGGYTERRVSVCEHPETLYLSNDESLTVYSPNYPDVYPNNIRCGLRIVAPYDKSLEHGCDSDYLEFFDESYTPYAKFCDNSGPYLVRSPGSETIMVFDTDGSFGYSGFNIAVKVSECASYQQSCLHDSRICISKSALCDGRKDCPGGSDEVNC